MGRDKSLLELEGQTLVEVGLHKLRVVCEDVAIAGGAAELGRFAQVIADEMQERGPLAGMVAALTWSSNEWNIFLAVDLPFVPVQVLRQLVNWAEGGGAMAVICRVEGRDQPLCGAYSKSCTEILRRQLHAGKLRVRGAVALLEPVHLPDFVGSEALWFRNLNTLDDFRAAGGVCG
jgi:molybdopterin-guanine dinucleotide biosynthesis protein A